VLPVVLVLVLDFLTVVGRKVRLRKKDAIDEAYSLK
jgi:hypothetical protein